MSTRRNIIFSGLLLLAAVIGIASRAEGINIPQFLKLYAGDTMWAFAVYYLLKLILRRLQTTHNFLLSLLFSLIVETSQLIKTPFLNRIRDTVPGGLLIGYGFHWSDLVCYFAGVSLAYVIDLLWISGQNR